MKAYVIRQPVVTEKSLKQANEQNVYTFEVERTADKNTIKAAIEAMYGVDVIAVNVVMRPKEKVRTGRKRLSKMLAKTKKALVKLKAGQTIDVFDIGG